MMTLFYKYSPFLALFLVTIGCAPERSVSHHAASPPARTLSVQERSAAYSQYLRGNHAEFNQRFDEALTAYQKAIRLDPGTDLLLEKLVITHIQMGHDAKAIHHLKTLIAKHPENTDQQLLLARLFIRLGHLDEAIGLYKQILAIAPADENAHLQLGLLFSIKHNYQQAESAFSSVINTNRKSYPAHLYLARLFAETEQIQKALDQYIHSLALDWSEELVNEIITFCSLNKKYKTLLKVYRMIRQQDPGNEKAGLGIVHTLFLLDRDDQAIKQLTHLKQTSRTPEEYDLILARYYFFSKKNHSRAQAALLAVLDRVNSPAANYLLGLVYADQKKYTKALERFRQLQPDDEEYQNATHLQIKILQDLKEDRLAVQLLQERIADTQHVQPFDFRLLGALYQDMGQRDAAITLLKQSLQFFSDDEELLFELGLLYEKSGLQQMAIKTMQHLLQVNEDHAEALNYLGYTWADNNIHLHKALDYIQQALDLRPNNSYIHDSLGWVHFRLGNLTIARKELERAASLTPNDPTIRDHLGDVYSRLSLTHKALRSYLKALRLSSRRDTIQSLKKKIDQINTTMK